MKYIHGESGRMICVKKKSFAFDEVLIKEYHFMQNDPSKGYIVWISLLIIYTKVEDAFKDREVKLDLFAKI